MTVRKSTSERYADLVAEANRYREELAAMPIPQLFNRKRAEELRGLIERTDRKAEELYQSAINFRGCLPE